MDKFNSFIIHSHKSFSTKFKSIGITTFSEACLYIRALHYGRIIDRNNLKLVLSEQKGTCSTKHAVLKELAIENNFNDIQLCIGIYKMNNQNTKGIGNVLALNQLQYLPEAHTYLKYENEIYDLTSIKADPNLFSNAILYEEAIQPKQVGTYKIKLHQDYLKNWILEKSIPLNFESLWKIREQCIANLSA